MNHSDVAVAVFQDHDAAEAAVKKLAASGFAMKNLSLVGKGYHKEEKVVGFYNAGDRIQFWGTRGAYWGGLWGLFFGGLFVTIPMVGSVVVLGYLAATVLSALESAVMVGGLSALGAALYGMGIPKDSVLQYETEVGNDEFLVMVHGSMEEVSRAKAILEAVAPTRLDHHQNDNVTQMASHAA